ncbi:citrate synthase-like protein [Chytriomyces sp. MP71]|nr:citrate synthase-like protein [Chytriomyces sp. MP71]
MATGAYYGNKTAVSWAHEFGALLTFSFTNSYRGYNIEDLAEHSSFVEVAYLLIYGDLPTKQQLDTWNTRLMRHTYVHENMIDYMKSFRYDAHPVSILHFKEKFLSRLERQQNAHARKTNPDGHARLLHRRNVDISP